MLNTTVALMHARDGAKRHGSDHQDERRH
jgi:hypothetical protein